MKNVSFLACSNAALPGMTVAAAMKRLSRCLLLSPLLFSAAAAAQPVNYPTRPIRMIVPFGPGGASDFVARIIAPKMTEALGQQIVIDNRSGAAGNVGVEVAAHGNPDGYTVLLGNVGTMTINPNVFPKFPVRPLRDFIGISIVSDVPGALAVHPSVPGTTTKEFIAYAKSRPGQLNYSSTGPSSAQRLAFEFFQSKAGIKLQHVPYKAGAGAATIALLGGEVSATMLTTASFLPFVKSGRLKVIAVVSPKRVPQLPDVPTMIESGFPELTLGSWQGVFVPAGTPQAVVTKLFATTIKVMADAEVVERYRLGGALVLTSKSPQDFAAFLRTQTDFWAKLVAQLGVGEK
ncbi:MAG: tripartite tricarboxylate transporter substrate binding protein [Burkholderiales bacterium]|nr:tripartite tricarboxylate transporter substrate binding protein [Burkholderiales bacterium]